MGINKSELTAGILLCITLTSIAVFFIVKEQLIISPVSKKEPLPRPLLAYTFANLKKIKFPGSQITLGRIVEKFPNASSQMFYFSALDKPGSKTMKKVSGLINVPNKPGNYPVIVMFRGFAPAETYTSGIGTEPSAQVFAKNGFITLAPDFLGYGESASPSADSFEDRFQTYTTALTLLSSLGNLNSGLSASYSGNITADLSRIGIWGHSNGGHIALSVLSISEVKYPTVLWAPVSVSFPYSILYYTDESDDQGKALRKALAQFEENYDTDMFSPPKYYQYIKAPVQIDQGTEDHEVLPWWSEDLAANLKKNNIEVSYFTYPNSDHNFLPSGWSGAINNSMIFYKKYFENKSE